MESFSSDPVALLERDDEVFSSTPQTFKLSPKPSKTVVTVRQNTLRSSIRCVGTGLHTGRKIALRMEPAPADTGVIFQRTDIPGAAAIPALYDHVVDTRLSTVIGDSSDRQNRVATIEHLMSALAGKGIHNVRIFLDGPEVPVLDGSSADFLFLIDCAGRASLEPSRREIEILKTVRVEEGDAFTELRPSTAKNMLLSMTIDFPASAIGRQTLELAFTEASFRTELSFSRTFANHREIAALQAAGLALGGSLDNAVVVDEDKILNPTGLRVKDEFVRHKMLDAVGDLSLAGAQIRGSFTGYKSGHHLNNQLLRKLFADKTAWREVRSATKSVSESLRAA
ncbi:UDP-3-O-acyl-N-acetylglucosamine deacetylase [Acetobacter sp.]|jgi:UDP-3-O-[3-hydroxymyristoyl] N-acetylglucosamine deacetylase|uniref:UDP-3-O-acyl-N-acetylglucosamine deacetylase n=1 Tax=Acetobacter sp. TaxID=440 RepID=UPI0025C2EEFA|nr:UDP-3-O-acyl-N-acetylglucosamine deacetylase [Acetobacter sp.]MCH4089812.1 UDP-3-O-acyl-N-acetylglucosamine deacetylase [Acetobacter sp.]MCI1298508.1 UDP-3-O-acyl-N-acetylglucosamine deacetylase [Acetobacter sp.]MCI1315073.1 UDP-3-O-acyl-N-acetylglucosamine deacetylase [Acetobacter sp.]